MASIKQVSLPHGSIPTQMFGNVNLQNAIMYVNENFSELKNGVNAAVDATTESLSEKADASHNHDESYASLDHSHAIDSVIGLSSALDGKADLNHEHSQYLSSLPSHYHDVNGISGLGEQLQSKAEKTHGHTIEHVNGLSALLGVKASTAYVDNQINQVSSSIKTVADLEIEGYGAQTIGQGGSVSPDVPKDVSILTANETVQQKNERVGVAERWARADHRHVFETETSDLTKLKPDGNGENGAASFGVENTVPRIDHSHPLNVDATCTPSDVVAPDGSASQGSSNCYARADHVHKMVHLSGDDISYTQSVTVSGQIQDNVTSITENSKAILEHESRIAELESRPSGGSVTSVDGIQPVNGNVSLSNDTTLVQRSLIGKNNGVQSYSAKLTALESNLDNDGSIPVSSIYDSDCDAECIAICNNGEFGHSGSGLGVSGQFLPADFGGDWPVLKEMSKCFTKVGNALRVMFNKISGGSEYKNRIVTTDDDGNVATNEVGNGLKVESGVLKAKCNANGIVTVDGNGLDVTNISGKSGNFECEFFSIHNYTDQYGARYCDITLKKPMFDKYGRFLGTYASPSTEIKGVMLS